MSAYSFHGRKRLWKQRTEAPHPTPLPDVQPQSAAAPPQRSHSPMPKSQHEKWRLEQLLCLLRFYRAHRCLWDPLDADNRNRKLRKAALIDITAAMNDPRIRQSHVIQKINVLRATYRYEQRRIKQRMRQGIGAQTKLRWFALADSFLRHVPKTLKQRRHDEQADDTDSDLAHTLVTTMDSPALTTLTANVAMQEVAPAHRTSLTVSAQLNTAQTPPRWSAAHSLKFIKLLAPQQTLWHISQPIDFTAQQSAALQSIATALALPLKFVEQRLYALWQTLESEQAKMQQMNNYRPAYLWWALAEKLFQRSQTLLHFVTAPNAAALDAATLEQEMSADSSAADNWSDSELAINPIPSVAPPSVASINTQAALDELFEQSHSTAADAAPAEHNNTKLIWNGLEDDLLEGKWSLKHSVKFLRLYGAHRCLWDLKDADYRSRELRNAAIKDIAAAMGYGLDAAYVAKKIKIFRITYMQHRKRMLADIMAGKAPEIQLRWFPLADSFLRPHIGLRSIKEQQREIPQFDLQYVYANLNLIDPALLNDFDGKGTQNTIGIAATNNDTREQK